MKQILFTEPRVAALAEREERALLPHEVRIRTVVSTISAGTERANLRGDENVNIDKTRRVPFPRASGYSSAGVVVSVGDAVTRVKVGDRVAMSWSLHCEYNILDEGLVTPLPDQVSFEEAALYHIGSFSLAALRKCELEIGEPVGVFGLGVLGLFAVIFAHAAGATPVVAVDPVASRRETALRFGADYAFDPTSPTFEQEVRAVTGGGLAVAVEVTGVGSGLNSALDCMARFGRVALLGCTRDTDFSVDYYRKVHGPGVRLIGAHTLARPEGESSHGMFTLSDDVMTEVRLSSLGRISLADTVGETHSPTDCAAVYTRLLSDRDFPTVVQFDWRRL